MATEINIKQQSLGSNQSFGTVSPASSTIKDQSDAGKAVSVEAAKVDDKLNKADSTTLPQQGVAREELESAVKDLSQFAKAQNRNLEFSIDDTTGQTLVKVKDADTDEVIRQIPSEVAISLAKRMDDSRGGILEEIV